MSIAQGGYAPAEAADELLYDRTYIYKLAEAGKLDFSELAGKPIILLENEKNRRFFEERRKYLEARGLRPMPAAE